MAEQRAICTRLVADYFTDISKRLYECSPDFLPTLRESAWRTIAYLPSSPQSREAFGSYVLPKFTVEESLKDVRLFWSLKSSAPQELAGLIQANGLPFESERQSLEAFVSRRDKIVQYLVDLKGVSVPIDAVPKAVRTYFPTSIEYAVVCKNAYAALTGASETTYPEEIPLPHFILEGFLNQRYLSILQEEINTIYGSRLNELLSQDLSKEEEWARIHGDVPPTGKLPKK